MPAPDNLILAVLCGDNCITGFKCGRRFKVNPVIFEIDLRDNTVFGYGCLVVVCFPKNFGAEDIAGGF